MRKMARKLTNLYNISLKSSGINSTQIPILALLNIRQTNRNIKNSSNAKSRNFNNEEKLFNLNEKKI